jgi:asparagine synthase (glutamine-hydrolysing)
MCGIAGEFGSDVNMKRVQKVIHEIRFRGPDSAEVLVINNACLGACRLAMTDPVPRSNQPMQGQASVICFNGEIYNFHDLAKQKLLNHTKRTNSDTEVLQLLLSEFGLSILDNLQGSFAFAYYDLRSNLLTLSRDKHGKKPLYFRKSKETFHFSSLPRNISENQNQLMDPIALTSYLSLGYLVDPLSAFTDVQSVMPGESVTLGLSEKMTKSQRVESSSVRFTDRKGKSSSISPAKQVRQFILEAVETRVQGQNNISLSLSGGVDSAVIAVSLNLLGIRALTISMRWDDSDKNRYNTDSDLASQISRHLGHEHVEVQSRVNYQLENYLNSFLEIMQEPNNNPTGLSMIDLYGAVKEAGSRIVLTGDGADEIFGGYARYSKVKKFHQTARMIYPAMKITRLFGEKANALQIAKIRDWLYWHQIFTQRELMQMFTSTKRDYEMYESLLSRYFEEAKTSHTKSSVERLMCVDRLIWLSMESNRKLDRITMWHSIEARMPFQDTRLINELYLPTNSQWSLDGKKKILREAFPELEHLNLQKQKVGFISPLGHWMRCNKELVSRNLQLLRDRGILQSETFNNPNSILESGDFRKLKQLWTMLVLGQWTKRLSQ